jgi:hypothetical protein
MLVDTDVLIWYLRGHEEAARFLEGLPILRLSVVTWMELVQGCRNRQELERLKKDLNRRHAVILPISEAISERAMALVEAHFLGDGLLLADALCNRHRALARTQQRQQQAFQTDPGACTTDIRAVRLGIWPVPYLWAAPRSAPASALHIRWTLDDPN